MKLFCVLRTLLFVLAPLYVYFHVRTLCPVGEELDFGAADPLCRLAHATSTRLEPVWDAGHAYYAQSALKSHLDPHLSHAAAFVDSLKAKAFQKTNISQEELFNNFDSGSKLIINHTVSVSKFVYNFVADDVYPVVAKYAQLTWSYVKYAYFQTELFVYINYNLHVKPLLRIASLKISQSPVGENWRKLVASDQYQLVASYCEKVYHVLARVFNFFVTKWTAFREYNKSLSMDSSFRLIEEKKKFILQELSKFMDSHNQKEPAPENIEIKIGEDGEETEIIHSTITVTKTSLKAQQNPTSTLSPISEKYSKILARTIDAVKVDFDDQVHDLSLRLTQNLSSKFSELLQKLNSNVSGNYNYIYDLLNRINQVTNSDLDGYVSRELYLDALKQKSDSFSDEAQDLLNQLNIAKENYVLEVAQIRSNILEVMQEFGDSSLNAYSSEIIESGSDWKDWKDFNNLKSDLIKFRDYLIHTDCKDLKGGEIFESELQKFETHINALLNEGGSYLYILRAKGNLQFQMREAEEQELLKIQQEQEEQQKQLEEQQHEKEEAEEFAEQVSEQFVEPVEEVFEDAVEDVQEVANEEKYDDEEEEQETETSQRTVLEIQPLTTV